ncbi:helix-turn-helix domain-containing protein [Bacillus sp. JJ722]|uniref:helix-turn-helix domain-containing protein n=1 Tax=Bacillus sp. JJ722 TaxID=3122973 RepID=UPI002FFDDB01
MNINDMVVDKVNVWLKEAGKTQQWLADEMGVSKSLVGHILNKNRNVQSAHIQKFADIMGISLKELISMKDPEEEIFSVQFRGNLTSKEAEKGLKYLLFAIEDYEHIVDIDERKAGGYNG